MEKEFLKLISANKGIIIKICNTYCKLKVDRDDLAQEIIFQLWKSFVKFESNHDAKFSTWMYRVALNTAISFYRKDKKNTTKIDISSLKHELIYENENESDENMNLLQDYINELNELDKALIILYLEDNSNKEIASIIGISETNVSTKLHRIREKLKTKLVLRQKIWKLIFFAFTFF